MSGLELRLAILTLGVSQTQFAVRIGRSDRQVRRWLTFGAPAWVEREVDGMLARMLAPASASAIL